MVSDFEGSVASSILGVVNYVLSRNDNPQTISFYYMTQDI
jgi:hypothetical protein